MDSAETLQRASLMRSGKGNSQDLNRGTGTARSEPAVTVLENCIYY